MAHTIKSAGDLDRRSISVNVIAFHAEITLLKQDPQAGDPLSRLNFTVGGRYPAAVQHDDRRWRQRLL